MPVPTGRLALAAAAGAVVVLVLPFGAPIGLLIVVAALVLAAAADVVLAAAPSTVGVVRQLPGVLPLGAEGQVAWTVTNPLAHTLRVAIADQLAPSLHPGMRRVRLTVPGRGRAEAVPTIRPARRGRFEPVEVVVRVAAPLGLARR